MIVKYTPLKLFEKYISLWLLIVWKKKGKLYFIDLGGWAGRNDLMINILKESLNKKEIKDFSPVVINTGDRPINKYFKFNIFSFTTTDGYYDKIIPDRTYDSWKECGIPEFNKFIKEIKESGKNPAKIDKIGRIGNFKTSTSRLILANLSNKYPQYLDIKDSNTTKYISLPDLVNDYKYLIDVEGIGFSGRLKYLFFSGRPVFVQERIWKEYALIGAVPGKDYIPIKNDFSDLIKKIEEYYDSDLIDQIGKSGQNFAINNLNKEKAHEYIRNEFINLNRNKYNKLKIIIFVILLFFKVFYAILINLVFKMLKIKKAVNIRR